MFDEQLRKFLEYYKLKAAKSVPAYISANDISLIGLALTILAIFTYYMDWYILTFVIGVLAILTDGLDGKYINSLFRSFPRGKLIIFPLKKYLFVRWSSKIEKFIFRLWSLFRHHY